MKKKKRIKKVSMLIELNPVLSQWTGDLEIIRLHLSYNYTFWLQGQHSKEPHETTYCFIKKDGTFPTGFIPKVKDILDMKGVKYKHRKKDYKIVQTNPEIKGLKLRPYQEKAVTELIKAGRGVWQDPTGGGKTIEIMFLLAAYKDIPKVVVVHTKDLFDQTYEELKMRFGTVGRLKAGLQDIQEINVGMIQIVNKLNKQPWKMVIIDECHHVSSEKGGYAKFLDKCKDASLRFGFTATVPEKDSARLALESTIGPVIGSTSYEELVRDGYLSKPKMVFKIVPEISFSKIEEDARKERKRLARKEDKKKNRDRKKYNKYYIYYSICIAKNRARNDMIIKEVEKYINQGLTTLIMVERISHGKALLKIAEMRMPGVFAFVHGQTADEIRREEKKMFQEEKRKGIIATRIWSEGINITSIRVIANAIGGLSELRTIQNFGRGFRKTDDKDEVVLIDFLDANSHTYFMRHSMNRITYYSNRGWI